MWASGSTSASLQLERLISSMCFRLVFQQHQESSPRHWPHWIVQLLCTSGIRVRAYLDDWVICADSPDQSVLHTQQTIQLLQTLGWIIYWKKSILEPSRTLDFLGLHFNLKQAIVSPADSFVDSLISVQSRLSASTAMPANKITSINSWISHYVPFIHHSRLQLRFL